MFSSIGIGKAPESKPDKIHSGIRSLYVLSLAGPLFAAVILIVVAFGVDEEKAKFWLGAAAAVWGASTGAAFRRLFADYARAGGNPAG